MRRFVEESFPEATVLDDVILAASEVAANVSRHAKTGLTVGLIGSEEVIRKP